MIRVFTKKPGEKPNLADEEGIILRNGATVEHCCHAVHRSIKESVFLFFSFDFWHNIFYLTEIFVEVTFLKLETL